MGSESRKSRLLRAVKETDLFLLSVMLVTCIYGFLLVYSVSYTNGTGLRGCLMQLISLVAGLIAAAIVSFVPYKRIVSLWPVLAGGAVLLMLLTFTPLGINVPGTDDTAWLGISVGSFSVSVQPSELLKIVFIITFSKHLSIVHERINSPMVLLALLAHGLFPTALVFLQGDDGTATIFALIIVGMLFAAGLHPLYFLGGFAGIAALIPFVWSHLTPDKQARFLCIFFVDRYAATEGWQQSLALSSIGSGGLHGLGWLQGDGSGLYARNNDMIFTVAGEEFGFIGAVAVLLMLGLILLAVYRNARRAKSRVGSYMCIGMMCYIGFQAVINIGMNLRLLPIVGITLPFFSAGGTSLATLLLGMGLIFSVHRFSSEERRESRFH